MILIINTSEFDKLQVALFKDDKILKQISKPSRFAHEEILIKSLDSLFTNTQSQPGELNGIIVVSGPGSFSALRIGLSVANTLAWQLKIPVVGVNINLFKNLRELYQIGNSLLIKQKGFKLVLPNYGKEPNINLNNKRNV